MLSYYRTLTQTEGDATLSNKISVFTDFLLFYLSLIMHFPPKIFFIGTQTWAAHKFYNLLRSKYFLWKDNFPAGTVASSSQRRKSRRARFSRRFKCHKGRHGGCCDDWFVIARTPLLGRYRLYLQGRHSNPSSCACLFLLSTMGLFNLKNSSVACLKSHS